MESTEALEAVGGDEGSINVIVTFTPANTSSVIRLPLQVHPMDSITRVKAKIQEVWRIPRINQRLLFMGKNLEDNRRLADYNIRNESLLNLTTGNFKANLNPFEILHGTGSPGPAQQQKRFSNYSRKSTMFMITMLVLHMSCSSASFCIGDIPFIIALAAFVIIDATFHTTGTPELDKARVYLSSFLMVFLAYIQLVSFNKYYGFAIFFLPFPIIVPTAFEKVCKYGGTDDEADQELNSNYEEDDQHLDSIFDLASDFVNWGGIAPTFYRQYMAGPVREVGFFYFFYLVVGIYLMVITTVRTAILTPHATGLAILMKTLFCITVITAMIHVRSSGGNPNA